jgi:hypothetical protein
MRAGTGAAETTASHLQQRNSAPGPDSGEQLLRAMTEMLAQRQPASPAEALNVLRRGYPEVPLALRIAALRAGSAR